MPLSLAGIAEDVALRFGSRVALQYANQRLPAISRVDLFVTEDCTLRCDYCFVSGKDRRKRMSWDTARKAVDLLFVHSSPGSRLEVTFFGGEPLLEFPLIRRAAAYARDRAEDAATKIGFSLTTNGTIASEEIARFGREYGFNLLVSIDGLREAHDQHRVWSGTGEGSWDTVVGDNFRLLKSIQGWMGARVTVCPDTVHTLSSGIQSLFHVGVNQLVIGPDVDAE